MVYEVPKQYYFRLHHVRPRFKSNLESVLYYVANKICQIGKKDTSAFKDALNTALYAFPGNADKTEKTINNWRTEICALFGFFIENGNVTIPGNIAKLLSNTGDIPQTFDYFLYKFQYPGAHIKAASIKEEIENKVKFQPAKYILKTLKVAKKISPDQPYITCGECTHCIFNDLRCTQISHESYDTTWNRIISNRKQNVEYDTHGDITRYAKDILDYMCNAGLLNKSNNAYFINELAHNTISEIENNKNSFTGYDELIKRGTASLDEINKVKQDWFIYVNNISNIKLATDVYAYMNQSLEKYNKDKQKIEAAIQKNLQYKNTKEIGDQGEGIVYQYELNNIKKNKRQDLAHLITFIPTPLAVGYDFNSIEPDTELRRYIEVKSTISSSKLVLNSFHMTPNEVRTARTVGKHYFIYRLKIMRDRRPLLTIIQNPIALIESNKISGDLTDTSSGLDVSYDSNAFKEVEI